MTSGPLVTSFVSFLLPDPSILCATLTTVLRFSTPFFFLGCHQQTSNTRTRYFLRKRLPSANPNCPGTLSSSQLASATPLPPLPLRPTRETASRKAEPTRTKNWYVAPQELLSVNAADFRPTLFFPTLPPSPSFVNFLAALPVCNPRHHYAAATTIASPKTHTYLPQPFIILLRRPFTDNKIRVGFFSKDSTFSIVNPSTKYIMDYSQPAPAARGPGACHICKFAQPNPPLFPASRLIISRLAQQGMSVLYKSQWSFPSHVGKFGSSARRSLPLNGFSPLEDAEPVRART